MELKKLYDSACDRKMKEPKRYTMTTSKKNVKLKNIKTYEDAFHLHLDDCRTLTIENCYFKKGIVITGMVETMLLLNVKGEIINSNFDVQMLEISCDHQNMYCLDIKDSKLKRLLQLKIKHMCVTYQNPFYDFCVINGIILDKTSKLTIESSRAYCDALEVYNASELNFSSFKLNFTYPENKLDVPFTLPEFKSNEFHFSENSVISSSACDGFIFNNEIYESSISNVIYPANVIHMRGIFHDRVIKSREDKVSS